MSSSVGSASSSSSSSSNPLSGSNALAQLSNNFETFLSLLTTQLQNQDPTSPQDTNALTQQLVSMSGVEQQIETNQAITNLYSLMSANQASQQLGYIGQVVGYSGNNFAVQTSQTQFSFNFPTAPASATLSIFDSSGTLVAQKNVTGNAGLNSYTWDGKDTSGKQLPAGAYSYKLSAFDAKGQSITDATSQVLGQVTGVDNSSGSAELMIGAISVPLSSVQGIFGYPASSSSSSNSNSDSSTKT